MTTAATVATPTFMSPQEYLLSRSAETTTDTTASDEWFAQNAVEPSGRYVVGAGQGFGGLINMGRGLFNSARGMNIAETTLPIGANQITDSVRTFAEGTLLSSETAKEAQDSARLIKVLSIASLLPLTALAISTSTPMILGALAAGTITYFRYRAAVSVEKQVDIISHPERATFTESEKWFDKNKSALRLPRQMRNIERFLEYGKAGLYGLGTLLTVFNNPFLGIFMGVASWYSFWKAHNVIPPIAEYYDRMADRTEELLKDDD